MHQCLQIAEILGIIMDFLVTDGIRGAREVLALLKTCKTFYDPALDIMWRNLDMLAPLVMCLPKDIWKIKNKLLYLQRPPGRGDSSRFIFHAKRVKSLGLEPPKTGMADRFNLRLHHDAAEIIVPVLAHMCPSLSHLNLCSSIEAQKPLYATATAISAFSDLKSLVVNTGLTNEMLNHLGQMSKLVSIETRWDPREDPGYDISLASINSIPQKSLFPALEELALSACDLVTLIALLKLIRSHKIDCLSLVVNESLSSDFFRLFAFLQSEEDHFALLRRVLIRHPMPVHYFHAFPVAPVHITGLTLQPLFKFSHLTVVDLNPPINCLFDLDNDVLLMMATSWPSLRILHLGNLLGWRRPSSITLDGLLPLITYCPELQSLGLAVDATVDPVGVDDMPINDKITCLHLGDSKINPVSEWYPSDVATFLSELFPYLTKIHVCGREMIFSSQHAWETVEAMISQLRELGEIASSLDDWDDSEE